MMLSVKTVLPCLMASALLGCVPQLALQNESAGGLLSKLDEVADTFSCDLEHDAVNQFSDKARELFEKETKEQCRAQYIAKGAKPLRLLRAQLIAVVITRYGIAKIKTYSEEKEVDAARLATVLAKLKLTLTEAKASLNQEEPIASCNYPVVKADLYIDYIDLGVAAIRPVAKEARGLLFASRIEKIQSGKTMLIGLLKNALYREAYAAELANIRAEIKSVNDGNYAKNFDKGWKKINTQLVEQCQDLIALNKDVKVDLNCQID